MNERDVLRRAKEVLLERGWSQGVRSCRAHPCIGFAVLDAAGIPGWDVDNPLLMRLATVADARGGPASGALALWNDAPGRTLTEVIDLLDKALASLEPSKTPELVA